MSIGYKNGRSSLTFKDFLTAKSDADRLEISIRLITENYETRHDSSAHFACVSFIAYHCGNIIDWSDFVKDSVEGVVVIHNTPINVHIMHSGTSFVDLFDQNFHFVGNGAIYAFEWERCPDFFFRSTEHHDYIETEDDLSRLIFPDKSAYKKMTHADIETVKKRWEDSVSIKEPFILNVP